MFKNYKIEYTHSSQKDGMNWEHIMKLWLDENE